jgi:hypothetical protein
MTIGRRNKNDGKGLREKKRRVEVKVQKIA